MATLASEVFDLFTSITNDYRFTTIYTSSGSSALNLFLEPWLLFSINDFDSICDQDLTYSTSTQSFAETLTIKNKLVLAQIMVRYWLQKEVQNIQQLQLHLQDRDFRTHSENQNLKEKLNLYNAKREEISQALVNYKLEDSDMWEQWNLQNFV